MSGILITFHEVIRVFRTWMGGDELPLGGGFCRFRSKPRCQIFFQNGVIFRAPANRPFFGFPMPFPVKLPVLSGIAENLRQSGVKFRLRKILQSKNLLKHFRRKIQFVDMNLKNHRKTRRTVRIDRSPYRGYFFCSTSTGSACWKTRSNPLPESDSCRRTRFNFTSSGKAFAACRRVMPH